MPPKKMKPFLGILSLCLLALCFNAPADAAISKTSKRTIRSAANPALVVVPDFNAVALSTSSVQWSWSTGSFTGSGIDGYYLYSSTTATRIALTLSTSFYIDAELVPNRQYTRWMTSYQGTAEGSDSNHIEKFTYAVPPATFNFDQVTATGTYITWHFSAATAYEIQCSTNGGTDYTHNRAVFVPWQTIPLLSNKDYMVRMGAINGDNELTPGIYSAIRAFTTPPLTPDGLNAVAISSYTIEWRWSTGTFTGTGITGYQIYHSTLSADGTIPVAGDIGEVIHGISDPSINSWTETYVDADPPSADSRHTRWLTAVGIIESKPSDSFRKYTYAIAPATCALKSPDFQNIFETSLNLDWNIGLADPRAGIASKYVIHYSTAADFNVSLASETVGSHPAAVNSLSANTKYDFRIGAINGDDEQTPGNPQNPFAYSATYKVLTRPKPLVPTASAVTDTSIKWSWSTGTYTSMNYIVGYGIGIASHTTELGDFVLPIDYISGTDTTNYTLDYLLTNSTHTRHVWAAQFESGYDSYGSFATGATGATFATPPNDVSFDTITARSVGVWWKEPEVPATKYRVERSPNTGEKGPWVFVSSVTGTHYNDTGLTPTTTYSYRIGAINLLGMQTLGLAAATDGNRRDYSFVRSTVTLHRSPTLYAVAGGTKTITWWWTNDVPGVQSFNLYTSTDGILASGLAASATYWTEVGLPGANVRYYRRVRSVTTYGEGDFSEASAATFTNPPDGVAVSTAGVNSLTVSWTANGSSRYRIDRSEDRSNWTTMKSWADVFISTSFTDTNLRYAATYYYSISGYNEDGILSVSSSTHGGLSRTPDLPADFTPVYSTGTATQSKTAVIPGVGQITVEIPPAATAGDGYISISTDAGTNPSGLSRANLDTAAGKLLPNKLVPGFLAELYFYDSYGYPLTGNFARPVKITFTYQDTNDDDIIDGTSPQVGVNTLKILNLDTAALEWKPEKNSIVDKAAKTVYAYVNHFSFYALGSLVSSTGTLSEVFAYPNPYKPGSGGDFDKSVFGEGIVFESLPAKAEIRIFNIAGGLVAKLKDTDGDGRCLWNTKNEEGARVASGVYIYLVTGGGSSGGVKSGKITIIR